MAAKTVAERMSEADQLMRSGLGLTVIADQGSDTLQVHDPLGMPMAGQPECAVILDPKVTHTNLDVSIVACDSPASEVTASATMNIAEPRTWRTYAGGTAKTEYLG
jgi:hypothetical protein